MSGMIGRTLEGYRIEAELGRGGQAVVYRATQMTLQRQVALKIVSHSLSADPSFLERFKREGISAANLDHPHVIPVYEAGEAEGLAYLAMKYVDGPSLDDVIRSGHGVEPKRGLAILRQAAEALDYAHARGLVHRDVKPANILLDANDHAYLSDFGLTRAMDGSKLTSSGVWMGTLEYVAPEQIKGSNVTSAADRYALAVVAYEVLTGRSIFDQPDRTALLYAHLHEPPVPPSQRRPELGPEVDAVFVRALSKVPEERPATSIALIDELTAAVSRAHVTGVPADTVMIGSPPLAAPGPPAASPPAGTPPPSPTSGTAWEPPARGAYGSPPAGTPYGSPPAGTPHAGRSSNTTRILIAAGVVAAIIVVVVVMLVAGVFGGGSTNTVEVIVTVTDP